VPRALATFVVRIQGRGMGKAPRLTNYVDPLGLIPTPLLPFIDDESPEATEKNFSQLRSLVLASGAFPPRSSRGPSVLPRSRAATGSQRLLRGASFPGPVDSGVFDNNRCAAWTLADRRQADRPTALWADPRTPASATLQPAVRYLYLDPDTEVFPPEPPSSPRGASSPFVDAPPEAGFLSRVLSMSGDLVQSAQARELGQLVNERADLTSRLQLPMNNLPKASEHLWALHRLLRAGLSPLRLLPGHVRRDG
jgi:hypothetical protein